ncbi:MAG TPA: radical SAM protein [Myxococcota bacterium]
MSVETLIDAARTVLADDATVPLGQSIAVDEGRATLLRLDDRRCLAIATRASDSDDVAEAARAIEIDLRRLSSESLLLPAGLGQGFRIEDLVVLQLAAPAAKHAAIVSWWRRRLVPETVVDVVAADVIAARAVFAERGEVPTSQRREYVREPQLGGRARVEAFELHVTEHCNLRCAHCCNTSPYLSKKTLEPAAIAATLSTMSNVLHADVFKIMGGEPLLHPEITEVLRVVKKSGVGDVVRLFTNGLLLSRMDDAFWRELDHLTVSSYTSAPVKPEHVALIEEKARAFDVVLNIKPVEAFSQVMHNVQRHDDVGIQQTWEQCWLRHRCLVARDGRFFICTRSAYLTDMHERVALTEPFADPERRRDEDSVAVDDPDLADKVLALLNRKVPLHACRFCLGGDGPREKHTQLSRDDVAAGRLRHLPILAA